MFYPSVNLIMRKRGKEDVIQTLFNIDYTWHSPKIPCSKNKALKLYLISCRTTKIKKEKTGVQTIESDYKTKRSLKAELKQVQCTFKKRNKQSWELFNEIGSLIKYI